LSPNIFEKGRNIPENMGNSFPARHLAKLAYHAFGKLTHDNILFYPTKKKRCG
jgi:hypothetical protein